MCCHVGSLRKGDCGCLLLDRRGQGTECWHQAEGHSWPAFPQHRASPSVGRMVVSALHILILGPCVVLWGHRASSVFCPSLGNISQLLSVLEPVVPRAGCSLQLLIQLKRSLLPCFNLLLNQIQDSQILALAFLPPLPLIATSPLLPSFVPCFGPLDLFSHPAVVLYEESVSCTSVGHQPKGHESNRRGCLPAVTSNVWSLADGSSSYRGNPANLL